MLPTDPPPDDLIGLSEACRLIPSHRPGKRLCLPQLRRWIQSGRVRGWRRGRWWLVSRADILNLPAEFMPPPALIIPRAPRTPAWARQVLERHGIR